MTLSKRQRAVLEAMKDGARVVNEIGTRNRWYYRDATDFHHIEVHPVDIRALRLGEYLEQRKFNTFSAEFGITDKGREALNGKT